MSLQVTRLHLAAMGEEMPVHGFLVTYAVDGNPAVVTTWRGVPVSVETNGRYEVTTSSPETALARDSATPG